MELFEFEKNIYVFLNQNYIKTIKKNRSIIKMTECKPETGIL